MKNIKIEEKLENGTWKEAVKKLTMPEQMRESLKRTCEKTGKKVCSLVGYKLRYARMIIPAACMVFLLAAAGMTVHAVYMNTHLRVFLEQDVTSGQIAQIERELTQIEGVSSCRFVDGDTAWQEFSDTYLTPEITEKFAENPLSESSNFEIGITLRADVEEIREAVVEIDGVRRILYFWEED